MAGHVVECASCGHVGAVGKKGSTGLTLLLLLFLFPIGVLYWLLNRSSSVCSACKSPNIKLYTPRAKAQQAISSQGDINSVQQVQCPDCREYIRYDARKCKHCGSMVGTP